MKAKIGIDIGLKYKLRYQKELDCISDTMIDKLYHIFKVYKKRYNLYTSIEIDKEKFQSHYSLSRDHIYMGIYYIILLVKESNIKERSGESNIYNCIIFALLHEIFHSIDYKYNKDRFDYELKRVNLGKYQIDKEYHNKQGFEKRADEFAKKELKKWIVL